MKVLKETGLHKEVFGKTTRQTFRRQPELIEVPYLLDVQMQSFKRFLSQGIRDVLDEFNPITDYSGKVEIYFLDFYIADEEKYTVAECLRRGQMYVKPLKVKVRVVFKETGEVIEHEVFLGDIPMMTKSGYFVINGVARVIVNQIIKSPNVYFEEKEYKKTHRKDTIECTITPTHGTYIELLKDSSDMINVYPNKSNRIKVSLGTFLKGIGLGSDEDVLKLFGDHPIIAGILKKDKQSKEPLVTKEDCLLEMSRKMRSSELPSAEAMENTLNNMFFTFPNYDLAMVGRYKFNKKLCIASRIVKQIAAADIKVGKEVVVKAEEEISKDVAEKIQNAGINSVTVLNENGDAVLVVGNNRVELNKYLVERGLGEIKDSGINELVHLPTLVAVIESATKDNKVNEKELKKLVTENARSLVGRHLYKDDIIATVSYMLNLTDSVGAFDNIDHLGNRRLNTVGDLMARHFKDGMLKLRQTMRDSMQTMELSAKAINPLNIINAKAISRALKDF